MAGPRLIVDPPAFVDRQFGLLSVVQPRYDAPDEHWRNGVTWQDTCGMGGVTYDPYCLPESAGNTPADKAGNITVATFGARPFTVFGEVNCSPVGYSQEFQRARAVDALTRTEQFQVEQAVWTGAAGGDAGQVVPHLAADTAVFDTSSILQVTLQCAATSVSGSTVLDITEGLQRLEAAMGACWPGQLTIHVPLILGQALIQWGLVKTDGAQLKTISGNLVALGAGYPGTSPAGVATANVAWMYATGPVMAYRSRPETFTFKEMFNRTNNTLQTIVERTYVVAYGCCCTYAVPISVGGDITGQPLSAF
jgi:hypothetical protein